MPITKQPININFAQGLDTKTDPFQVDAGKFLSLQNTVFNKGGLLQKRNGYSALTALPDTSNTFCTTYNGNLTAIGKNLNAYTNTSGTWVNKGTIQSCQLTVTPTVRSGNVQSQADSVVSSNGLVCTVYTDNVPSGGSTVPSYKYIVADSITGQVITGPTVLPGVAANSPRVFLLGGYFVIVFGTVVSATPHLQFLAISTTSPTTVSPPTDITTQFTPSTTLAYDAVVANNNLYVAWNGSDGGGAIRMSYIDQTLAQHNTILFAGRVATLMSLTADTTSGTPTIYVSFYNAGTSTGYTLAVNQQLNVVFNPVQWINSVSVLNVTSSAQNGTLSLFYEVANSYAYDGALKTNFIRKLNITSSGSVGATTTVVRSVGLASKSFIVNSKIYMLTAYSSIYQPTYFLVDSSGNVVLKLAYSNGGGYLTTGLPNVTVSGLTAQVAYLYKDQIQAVNKSQGAASVNGVYAQTGVNLATIVLSTSALNTAEIGGDLHLSGGFLWMYDGNIPVEHNFHLWADAVELTAATLGGNMSAQQYYYQVTYEWADAQGNIFRSAPSIPVTVTTSTATSKVTVHIPTLRLTYKGANNPIKLVVYRWSAAQQTYYQVTSIAVPTLNDTTVDYLDFVDTQADSAIIGNNILYTTGGVVEDIGSPPTSILTLYKSRLFLVDAEDPNLLWFSKQVIEATPVEMSDLFTLYVAPTTSAQGSTGPITALAALDDKLIIFKRDAIYYITGNGPDNTGANNDFSEPVFITSTVGCSNQNSIVFMPTGLMFQSDKGIWLLGRDLNTSYIGAPVEQYNSAVVQSAVNVPATNQVRFTLDSGVTLMYDYFYGQWGTFVGVPAISSTLYQNLHTFINSYGKVYQESPGVYLDGSNPVLMSFTTSWLKLGGLQGYQRAYFFYLLGQYITPHKIQIGVSYDYNPAPTQTTLISPTNFNAAYGLGAPNTPYGQTSNFGGPGTLEQWRVFLTRQRCESVQITINELYDGSFGIPAGAGFTLSGLNVVAGFKNIFPTIRAANSVGR